MKLILVASIVALIASSTFVRAESARPNIVLFLADDLGYANLGCYDQPDFSTPNIDKLATDGLKFTDAHSPTAVCQPSRYAILAGRWYWRSSWGRYQSGMYFQDNEILLPQVLKDAGYSTAIFGKWHLGFGSRRGFQEEPDWNSELKPGPLECGFDFWFGMPNAHNMPPFVFIENHRVYKHDPADPIVMHKPEEAKEKNIPQATGWGASSGAKAAHEACPRDRLDLVIGERAAAWVAKQTSEKPFFLYVPFFAPHAPVVPAKEFLGQSPMAKRLKINTNATRTADIVQQMDHAVGVVMNALKEKGLLENTIVVFSSDNGNINLGDNQAVGFRTNGPFNGNKGDIWEGGHRVPMIVSWPGHIPEGKTCDKFTSLVDLYRTFLSAAEIPVPSGAAPDSLNMLPLWEHPDTGEGRKIKIYRGKGHALRVGDWVYVPPAEVANTKPVKLVSQGAGGHAEGGGGPAVKLGFTNSDFDEKGRLKPDAPLEQIYNLRNDPSQTNNLFHSEPGRLAVLQKIHEAIKADKEQKPLEEQLKVLTPEEAKLLGI
jgi:arylsulfatase A